MVSALAPISMASCSISLASSRSLSSRISGVALSSKSLSAHSFSNASLGAARESASSLRIFLISAAVACSIASLSSAFSPAISISLAAMRSRSAIRSSARFRSNSSSLAVASNNLSCQLLRRSSCSWSLRSSRAFRSFANCSLICSIASAKAPSIYSTASALSLTSSISASARFLNCSILSVACLRSRSSSEAWKSKRVSCHDLRISSSL